MVNDRLLRVKTLMRFMRFHGEKASEFYIETLEKFVRIQVLADIACGRVKTIRRRKKNETV
jgi:hypothetical protein